LPEVSPQVVDELDGGGLHGRCPVIVRNLCRLSKAEGIARSLRDADNLFLGRHFHWRPAIATIIADVMSWRHIFERTQEIPQKLKVKPN